MCLLQARTQGQRHRPGRTPLGQSDAVMRAGQHVASMGLDQRKGALLPRAEGAFYSSFSSATVEEARVERAVLL